MNEERNIDTVINGLCDELEPCKCLAHPFVRVLPFLGVAIIYIAALVYFIGVRSELTKKFADASFMFELFLMAFMSISAAIASSYLAVPGACEKKWIIVPPLTAFGIFCVWSLIRAVSEGMHMPALHMDHCMGEGMFMAIIPMTMMIVLVRNGATTSPKITALMNALAAAGLGYVGLRFTCSMDTVGHATVSHLLPYVVIGMIMGLGARKLFKW